VSAVLRLTEVSEVKSVMPITASVGEDGLATAFTIEIATDVQLIDRVQGITTKTPQSFYAPISVAV
jgi:hypothetical protein